MTTAFCLLSIHLSLPASDSTPLTTLTALASRRTEPPPTGSLWWTSCVSGVNAPSWSTSTWPPIRTATSLPRHTLPCDALRMESSYVLIIYGLLLFSLKRSWSRIMGCRWVQHRRPTPALAKSLTACIISPFTFPIVPAHNDTTSPRMLYEATRSASADLLLNTGQRIQMASASRACWITCVGSHAGDLTPMTSSSQGSSACVDVAES